MLMNSTSPPKDTIWETGLEKKTDNLLFTRDPPMDRNKHWLRMKGRKIYQVNGPQNRQK
jgi:hypothetical protein